MTRNILIHKLKLKNFLSYGSEGEEIALQPLNVLIGPNASGKSNFIEALGLLRATATDLAVAIRKGGGIGEWLWKGGQPGSMAQLEAVINYPDGSVSLRYQLCFTSVGQRMEIVDEIVENERPLDEAANGNIASFYRFKEASVLLNVTEAKARPGWPVGRIQRALRREDINIEQSILAQRKDADIYPEITYLGSQFGQMRLYTDWNLGRYSTLRVPQKTDDPDDFLLDDASNLGLILNDLQHRPETKQRLVERFRKFYDTANDITTKVQGNTIQIFVHEDGLRRPIPASRLSDGTLRYLALLAILCHPNPPPLISLEEPELGLHPDILPEIADLLVETSQQTQLVVTTHSDILVSALTDTPEAILVCERDGGGSHLHRLDAERLKKWLEDYSLGDLWRMGEIGGTRW